jgi:cysteine desulfurase
LSVQAYLDHASTTPLRPEALAAMLPYLGEHFGNPAGAHAMARRARRALDDARDDVAACLGCEPGEVVFTSGGTESDNLAVLGAHRAGLGTVLCSAIEHHAVLDAVRAVGGTVVGVDRAGRVDLGALEAALTLEVGLVSVMLVNNEVGTVQPLEEVSALVRARAPRALVHTDAVAAAGWMDLAAATSSADLVSISAHKFGGPVGTGALVMRAGATIAPVLFGGSQERDRRPGTVNVAGAVGTAAALRAAESSRPSTVARVRGLRDRLALELGEAVERIERTGSGDIAPHNFHLLVDGVDQEELLLLLDDAGVCASAGSACASGALEPSHVLLAMGVDPARARSALRLTLGYSTTADEVDHVVAVLPKIVERLRG